MGINTRKCIKCKYFTETVSILTYSRWGEIICITGKRIKGKGFNYCTTPEDALHANIINIMVYMIFNSRCGENISRTV